MARYCLLAWFFLFCTRTTVAQEPFKYEKKITELVEPYREHKKFDAISIGVLSHGEVWEKSFGSLDQKSRFAPPHNLALLPDSSWDFDALAGCGAIRSNVDDMLTFAKAVLNPPKGPLGKAIELAWKKQKDAVGDQHAMGLGWMIAQDGATRWHNGQTGGYHSMILINRPLKTAVVLLSNTANPQLDQLTEQIFRAVIGMEVQPTSFDAEFQVKPEVAKRLEGKYQLAPGAILTVQVKEGKMMAQLTGQQFLALIAKSETEWKYQLVDATPLALHVSLYLLPY